jgi:hypothetical protein
MEEKEVFDATIYRVVHGSRAYGTHRPDSDCDEKGVCIVTDPRYYFGFSRFEQKDSGWSDNADRQIYDIRKFIKLALECNPNIIEILYVDESSILHIDELGQLLRDYRDMFLSQKAANTFIGYAMSQLHRIQGHYKWLQNPPNKPDEADFYHTHYLDEPWDEFSREFDNHKIMVSIEKTPSKRRKFGVFDKRSGSALGTRRVVIRHWDKGALKTANKKFSQYGKWKRNRNPKRAALETEYGYDCYSDDTLFLTNDGWKNFNNVNSNDKLATVYIGPDLIEHKFGRIEYQAPLEKFEGNFSGNMYQFNGHHTDVLVTPNHRMLYRRVSRKKKETYNVVLDEASRMPEAFDFLRTVTPQTTRFEIEKYFSDLPINAKTYMRLMGWYLSDGCAGTRKNKSEDEPHVTSIRVSQKKGGRLHQSMARFQNKYGDSVGSSLYAYDKLNASGELITEITLSIRNKQIRKRLSKECGKTKSKRIPRYVFNLSKRMMEILFDAMCDGDGTIRKTSKQSLIYYTSLITLANDVNELALHCGWETSLWGPYKLDTELSRDDSVMYQIHVDKNANQFQRLMRRQSLEKVAVTNKKIVCFTVPNGTLVTRRNGRIGIHGNSKHAMHLIRLLRMGKEILTEGKVVVKRPDAQELNDIRDGKFTYPELIKYAKELKEEVREAEKTSALPDKPDYHAAEELLIKLVKARLSW